MQGVQLIIPQILTKQIDKKGAKPNHLTNLYPRGEKKTLTYTYIRMYVYIIILPNSINPERLESIPSPPRNRKKKKKIIGNKIFLHLLPPDQNPHHQTSRFPIPTWSPNLNSHSDYTLLKLFSLSSLSISSRMRS